VSPYEGALRRNVVVNALGLFAKGAQILPLLVMPRVFGADTAGLLILGIGLFEIASTLATTGFVDANTVLASRHADRTSRVELHRVLATAMWFAAGLALLLAVGTAVGLRDVVAALGPEYQAIEAGVALLAWALVPTAIARICLSAATACLRPEWEVFLGTAGLPVGLVLGIGVVAVTGGGVNDVFASVLVTQCALAVVGLAVLHRYVGVGPVLRAMGRLKLDRSLLEFAVPQGLHAAALTYIVRLDVLMLAAAGMPPAIIAWYGTAALLVTELRQVRMVFSGALAPIVPRHAAAGDRASIQRVLAGATRWVALVATPIALAFVVLRDDLLLLFSPAYRGDSAWLVVLLVGPLVNCFGGLAANFLVFLIHNRWNLANAVIVGALKTGLNLVLVPRLGLMGAAIASTVSILIITAAEIVELQLLEKVHVVWGALRAPLCALAAGAAVLAALWDPADLPGLPARVGLALAVAAGVVATTRWLDRRASA
jgi:O-antigen/teichoic acid export membrane protein